MGKALQALAMLALLPLVQAQGPTAITLDCPASSVMLVTPFSATFYLNGVLSCASLSAQVTFPNGTTAAVPEQSCANGIHSFQFASPQSGLHQVSVSGGSASASCSIARLPGTQPRFQISELPLALGALAGILLLFVARRRKVA